MARKGATDAKSCEPEWLADRLAQKIAAHVSTEEERSRRGRQASRPSTTGDEDEEKQGRREQRERDYEARTASRARNLDLGAALARWEPKLDTDAVKLLGSLVLLHYGEAAAWARRLCVEQPTTTNKQGKVSVRYPRGAQAENTINALAYLGSRRHAVAIVRLRDYDPDERTLTFHEKAGKTIRKPVPDRLADLIDAAVAAGVYESSDDYLIPGRAVQRRKGDRDDRIIWRIVREVARDAGVTTHVHALRAAFAVRFLEMKRNDVVTLKELMGHARIETTLVYLRRLNRRQAMETVRDLTYDLSAGQLRHTSVAPHDNCRPPQIAAKTLESSCYTEKEGFEPSMEVYTPITP